MSAHAAPPTGGLTLSVRGTAYPVLLPKLSDPRLHLAAVITTLQVLGQAAFHFRVSIAQILLSVATCALLEVAIALRKQRVLMWPASAMLTGNGVAFILRVPGTHHGDWWSLRGWWIFVAAALLGMAASLRLRRLAVPEPENAAGVLPAGLLGAWQTVRDDHAFRRLLIASFLFGFGCWIQTPAQPLLLVDVLQVSAWQVGVLGSVAAVVTLAGSAYWGRLVDRKPSLEALRVMYLLGGMTPLIYYVAWSPWVLLASVVTDSLVSVGLELVWMMAVIDVAGPQRTAQYVAISATLAGVRGVTGPLVGGLVIHSFGIHAVYLIAAILTFSAAWLVGRELRVRVPAPVLTP